MWLSEYTRLSFTTVTALQHGRPCRTLQVKVDLELRTLSRAPAMAGVIQDCFTNSSTPKSMKAHDLPKKACCRQCPPGHERQRYDPHAYSAKLPENVDSGVAHCWPGLLRSLLARESDYEVRDFLELRLHTLGLLFHELGVPLQLLSL